jgi:nucleoside-diphosphate-sugar epimerase
MSSTVHVVHRGTFPSVPVAARGPWFPRVSEIAPRVAADFIIVHMAMLAAIALVTLELHIRPDQSFRVGAEMRNYYLTVFWPLSFLFPLLYSIGGLYTSARLGDIRPKCWRAVASAGTSALLLAAVSRLWLRADGSSQTTLLIFVALVTAGTPGVRWLKHKIFESDTKRLRPDTSHENETVLVLGGAGYIGSILVRKLLARGREVRVLDSLVYGDGAIRDVLDHPHLTFIRGDCRNMQDVVGAMRGVRSVIDLAAIVGDPACDHDRKTAREINYAATRMMIEIAKGEGVGRFIFASSCSVYGAAEELMDETSDVHPLSVYAETKVDSEQALLAAATSEFGPTILRFSTIFGLSPRPRFDLVVNLLTARAKQAGVITIFNGGQWRPFLHVDDVAEAIVRVLEAPGPLVAGEIFNVGDDRMNYTLSDVAERISEAFPGIRVERADNSDHRDYRVSFNKIRERIGFTCSKTLEDGILELKNALTSGLVTDYQDPLYSNVRFLQVHGSPLQTDEIGAQVMAALAAKAIA